MQIRFGALSPKLHEQLGLSEEETALEQRLADAIVLCQVHFVLTDPEVHKARKRIVKMLEKKEKNTHNEHHSPSQ